MKPHNHLSPTVTSPPKEVHISFPHINANLPVFLLYNVTAQVIHWAVSVQMVLKVMDASCGTSLNLHDKFMAESNTFQNKRQ